MPAIGPARKASHGHNLQGSGTRLGPVAGPGRPGRPERARHPRHPGFDGDKAAGKAELAALGPRLSDLQERLHAEGVTGGRRSLLLVLQGMDTSGKGVVRHVASQIDPQGCEIASFKAPTKEELATTSCGGSAGACPGRAS